MSNKRVPTNKLGRFFFSHRSLIQGSVAEYTIVFLLFFVITTVLTKFVLFSMATQLFASQGDATAGFLWLNFADPNISPILGYTDMTNYPVGDQLGGPTLISYAATWLPLRLLSYLFGPVAGLNMIMIWGYVSSAMAMYWLVKRTTKNVWAAFFGGYAVAFVPYALYKSSGHISYILSGIFSIIIGIFIEFWQRPRTKWAIALGVALAAAFYTDGYFILMAIILASGLLVGGVIYGLLKRDAVRLYLNRAKYALVAILAFVLMLAPLIFVQLTRGAEVQEQLASNRSDIKIEIVAYRSNVLDFILPPSNHIVWGDDSSIVELHAFKNQRSNAGESMNYIAFTVYALVLVGLSLVAYSLLAQKRSSLRALHKDAWSSILLISTVTVVTIPILLAFMFSPEASVFGHTIVLPGTYLIEHGISFWRVMSRLFVVLNVILVLMASVSLYMLLVLILHHAKSARGKKITRIASVALAITCLSAVAFEYACSFPSRPFDFNKNVSETYHWLATQDSIKVIAELPFVDPLDTETGAYFTRQIVHGKKLINLKEPNDARINNALGSIDNPEVLDLIRQRGADAVLIRNESGACASYDWGRIIHIETVPIFKRELSRNIDAQLCTYKVTPAEVDGVFVVYKNGFSPSANAPDQSDVAFKSGGKGEIALTKSDFATRYNGRAQLTATVRLAFGVKGAEWRVSQGNKIVAEGVMSDSGVAKIDTTLNGAESAIIELITPGVELMLAQAYIEDVVVTAIPE